MKKLMAILLAVLMLTLPIACAESVFVFADPVVTVNTGEPMKLDFTGLELCFAGGEVNGIQAIRVDIKNDTGSLFGANLNVRNDQLVISIDGVSNVYGVQIPDSAKVDFSNVDLSGLDIDVDALMGKLMSSAEISQDGDTVNFKLPYTAVNEVIATILPALEGADIPGVDTSDFKDAASKLTGSDSGVNLEGSFTQGDSGVSVKFDAFKVQGGKANSEPVIKASADIGDAVDVKVDASGKGSLYFKAQPSGDQAEISLGAEANGMGFDLKGIAGVRDEAVALVEIQGDPIDLQSLTDEQTSQLRSDLTRAAGGLISYMFSALAAA